MSDDDGSAALEFITVGVLLLVPLVYLILALGAIQEQSMGVEAAARHTARIIADAPDAAAAGARGDQVIANISAQYGIDADAISVATTCDPEGVPCPSAGATITVTVATEVRLPLVPEVLGLSEAASVPVEGVAVQKISRLWGAE